MPARKLVATEEHLRKLETALRAGFWTYDLRSGVVEWSAGFYALFGLKPEVVLPDVATAAGLVHPEDQQDWGEILHLARKSRQTDRTIRIIRPDGQMIWVRSHFEGKFDRNGSLVAVHGILLDVSTQEIEREDAKRDQTFVHSLKKLTHGSVWRAGPDGKLIDKGEWLRLTGDTTEQTTDWDSLNSIHPDDRAIFRTAWQEGISRKAPISFTARVRDRSGKYIAYENRATPIEDDQENLIEWHGFSLPLTTTTALDTQRLTSAQIRAARALLDWTGPELAERSGVSFSTIKRMEKSEEVVKFDSVKRVRATFEDAGVRFSSGANGDVSVSLTEKV